MTPERVAELRAVCEWFRPQTLPDESLDHALRYGLPETLDEIERLDVIVGRWEGLADTYLARIAELERELNSPCEVRVQRAEARVVELERLRAWDEFPATLPGGLVVEHARLDGMWQELVRQRDDRDRRIAELERRHANLLESAEIRGAAMERAEARVAELEGWYARAMGDVQQLNDRIFGLERELADTRHDHV